MRDTDVPLLMRTDSRRLDAPSHADSAWERSLSAPLQTDHVRGSNRLTVLRALIASGPVSRANLAHTTGLSIPTVATIVQEFATRGIVRSDGQEEGTGGRPAQRVALDANACHVLAVDLSGHRALALRVDLRGRVRSDDVGIALAPGIEDELVAWLARVVHAPDQPPIARLAVAVPGVVDPLDGHVDLAPALGWNDFALAELLEAEFGRPTLLENDVNALALAELGYGVGAGAEHAIYLSIGSGIGAGLVVNGRLLRGAHAAAGEIGSSLTPAAAAGAGGSGDAPLERDLLALASRFVGPDGGIDLGSEERRDAFGRFAEGVRFVLHNLACALDPELMVVAWPADPERHLVRYLESRWAGPTPLRIVAGTLGQGAAARGVARRALVQVHEDLCRNSYVHDGRAP